MHQKKERISLQKSDIQVYIFQYLPGGIAVLKIPELHC